METPLERVRASCAQVCSVVLGKNREVEQVMTAILADGHILLQDVPGVGKTTMAVGFAKTLGLQWHRVQFTPDVLPSDLTGFSVYSRTEERFAYQNGSLFCSLLLADELNRTSPKTQSALLEAMEERQVTAEGVTRPLPRPFIVIATQNPFGSAGTQLLPESQCDRFIISLSLGYPDVQSEIAMAKAVSFARPVDALTPLLSSEELLSIQESIHAVGMKDEVYRYVVDLIGATRQRDDLLYGASPRATGALVRMSKAAAWLQGRNFVTPKDVLAEFPYVVTHRLSLSPQAKMNGVALRNLIDEIAISVRKPPMGDVKR